VISVLLASSRSCSLYRGQRLRWCFEGGGALGFAHIGVIEWVEDHHIPVDYLAGTSMGGLVGGLYASGMSPQERRGHQTRRLMSREQQSSRRSSGRSMAV